MTQIQILLQYYPNMSTTQTEEEFPVWGFTALMAGVISVLIYGFWVYNKQFKYWKDGIFPPNRPLNRENLMYAQACVAALLVKTNPGAMLDKMLYIDNYFRREYRGVDGTYRDVYFGALKTPVSYESVASWAMSVNMSLGLRTQFVKFLLELSSLDGILDQREYTILSRFISLLEMDQAILVDFAAKANGKRTEKAPLVEVSVRMKYLAVFGLREQAGVAEIKTKYRKMVKLCHPDRFTKEADEVILKAKKQFQELQQAYEWLMANS
jgi:DnaJ-domain-containing protein 1